MKYVIIRGKPSLFDGPIKNHLALVSRVGHTSLKFCSTNFGHKIVQKSLPKIFINFFRRFLLLKWA